MSDKATKEIMSVIKMSDKDREAYFMSLPPDGTSTILVEDLKKKPQSNIRDKMIKDAEGFWYDDFKSLNPALCPKMALNKDLTDVGYHDLAFNVRQGKYD